MVRAEKRVLEEEACIGADGIKQKEVLLTVTEWPACRRETATQRPAIPAPTTMMFSGMLGCEMLALVNR